MRRRRITPHQRKTSGQARARSLKTVQQGRADSRGSIELYDLVRTAECELLLGEETFRLRIELTRARRRRKSFRANVWATEQYRIQPTFPMTRNGQPTHEPCDELIWVNWSANLRRRYDEPFSASSAARAEAMVLAEVQAWVRHTRGTCSPEHHTWGECPAGGGAKTAAPTVREQRTADRPSEHRR